MSPQVARTWPGGEREGAPAASASAGAGAERRQEVEVGGAAGPESVVEEVGRGDAEERRQGLQVALGGVGLASGAQQPQVAGGDGRPPPAPDGQGGLLQA